MVQYVQEVVTHFIYVVSAASNIKWVTTSWTHSNFDEGKFEFKAKFRKKLSALRYNKSPGVYVHRNINV